MCINGVHVIIASQQRSRDDRLNESAGEGGVDAASVSSCPVERHCAVELVYTVYDRVCVYLALLYASCLDVSRGHAIPTDYATDSAVTLQL